MSALFVVKIASVFVVRSFLNNMRSFRRKSARGFTLIELLVVLAIIGAMLVLAKNVFLSPGKDQRINSGVQMIVNAIDEARATAVGNDTCTRVVVICDENAALPESYHLRRIIIQKFEHDVSKSDLYDGSQVSREGVWRDLSNEPLFLPEGIFFSADYSTELSWVNQGKENPLDIDEEIIVTRREGKKNVKETVKGFCFEFDEKGRYVTTQTKPGFPTCPRRLVLVAGRLSDGSIVPSDTDEKGRPAEVGGLVIWPSGTYTLMRTEQQVYDPNFGKKKHASSQKGSKSKKNKGTAKGKKDADKNKKNAKTKSNKK